MDRRQSQDINWKASGLAKNRLSQIHQSVKNDAPVAEPLPPESKDVKDLI